MECHKVIVDLSILKGGDSSFTTGFNLRVHHNVEVFLLQKQAIIKCARILICLKNSKINIQSNQ